MESVLANVQPSQANGKESQHIQVRTCIYMYPLCVSIHVITILHCVGASRVKQFILLVSQSVSLSVCLSVCLSV